LSLATVLCIPASSNDWGAIILLLLETLLLRALVADSNSILRIDRVNIIKGDPLLLETDRHLNLGHGTVGMSDSTDLPLELSADNAHVFVK